ncbi:MAG: branched-chain amino acid ABC transporter permease [Ruminococcaceae bacterium]|nr:branched-chain amino acid ABC transporter permease [Oscillospiraceae bacterium]
MSIISTLINGLSMGAVYALIALGYTMVYGIAKMLNFAHGDVIMVGSYVLFLFTMKIIKNPFVAIFMAIVFCVILGILVERIAYRPLRGAPSLAVLITAIGVSFFLQSVAQLIFTVTPKQVPMFNFKAIELGGVTIKMESIITLAVGIIVMIVLTLFVNKSKAGRAMLAVSEDRGAAQLMGVNVNRTIAITFAIGSALAALASVFMLFVAPVTNPTLGAMPGIKAFVAAVLGGIGSIPGAAVGGLILGIVEQLALRYEFLAPYSDAIVFAILIVVLLVKPSGILGKKRHEKV